MPTPDTDATRAVAEEALAQRIPPVRPDELRNPLGVVDEAVARAQNNAAWWQGLTDEQRQALIETYPQHIGNAEGIPATARDAANRQVLQQLRDRADQVQSKIDEGTRTSGEERRFLRRVNRLDNALRKAAADAARANLDGPLLLAFDPAEFGGDGRAVVSFGDDPHQADSVSWHAPGVQTSVHSLFGFYTGNALHHLQSVRQENPNLTAASIAWIGYDTPSGRGLGHMLRQTAARTGGEILHSDIRAFNAGRDALAGDGSHFTGNHVFGYSYGSTTTAYAGRDGRLAGHVRTISLIGSPGAGPLRHASEFGPGVDVYVASSSRDAVTALGGRTPGATSRLLGALTRAFGLGVDPAMDVFGAVRIAAEFPDGRNLPLTGGTHHAYYLHTDPVATPANRSESGANFGRIAAGNPERLQVERHRTSDGGRTVEPAAERAGPRRIWNPIWRRIPNCATVVTDQLSALFDRDIRLGVRASRRGVPARALFETLGLDAQFTSYADVEATLRNRPDGTTAVLVSRWSGAQQGGHAYLARKVDGAIRLFDPHTGEWSGWPPHWGQDAVDLTAVGYLTSSGEPLGRVNVDVPLRLDAADAVGRVAGVPAEGDFARRQAEYRAQPPATRQVDTRYADAPGDVVDITGDMESARRLARDLSGMYGPYRIDLHDVDRFGSEVLLTGSIFNGDTKIGTIQRSFDRDSQGRLVAIHSGLEITTDKKLRGRGFSKALTAEFERLYLRSGVDRAEMRTHSNGGSAWPPRGFTWDPDPRKLQESLNAVKDSLGRLRSTVGAEGRALLDKILPQLEPDNPHLPEPIDLLDLSTSAEPDLGRQLLNGVGARREQGLNYVKYYREDQAPAQPTGVKGILHRLFGGSRASENCAVSVASELSRMYGREIRVAAPRTSMGVTAHALFLAVGTSSEFQSYAQVEETLRGMAANSSAVLASRWAHNSGRSGGHAYLAVFDGRDVFLVDTTTGQRSGWPPDWGQDAVTRTAVGYLDEHGNPVRPLHDVPLQLAAADRISHVQGTDPVVPGPPDPVRVLGLREHRRGTLSELEASAVYGDGEARLRELDERLARDGVELRERARILAEQRNALKAWTQDLMANREVADLLAARETTATFEDLVARNEAKGLAGGAVYEAIIHSATHSGYAPGTLSDAETTQVYGKFELALRELNEQLQRDGVPVQDRARLLSDLRGSLRSWTRELMSNRAAAEVLASNERSPSFDDLVARNESKGLTGDAVYEAIIASATHSHYAQGTLSNAETRTVYTTFELGMREVAQRLENEGADLEERARTLYELRASLRSWTRTLMADRETAEHLTANEPNPSFEDLVARQQAKGRVGDEIYEAIIASATRSRPSVNESLGIDPENPPPMPRMRGLPGDDEEDESRAHD
ncbi:alpha/beta hydrolase [Mycolicibacterium rutilum]|uniref:alpha/beta hydrolase n=1 Tax=Mycolicibacterium rutilum TaxID=370526 RepID=UPI001F22FF95|nr:alpha/beta hydrolase [Mycolicibacterium rutilum]